MSDEMTTTANGTPTPRFTDHYPMPPEEEIKQNGFYYYCLSEQERVFYKAARNSEGLLEEIRMLQAKIQYIQLVYPMNMSLLFRAIGILERLQKTHAALFGKDRTAEMEAAVNRKLKMLSTPQDLMDRLLEVAGSTT